MLEKSNGELVYRRASTPINQFAKVDKSLLVHLLDKMGLSLTVEKQNKGEWNEFRVFSTTDGKPNWEAMLETAEKEFGRR